MRSFVCIVVVSAWLSGCVTIHTTPPALTPDPYFVALEELQSHAQRLQAGDFSYGVSQLIGGELYLAVNRGWSWSELGITSEQIQVGIERSRQATERAAREALERLRLARGGTDQDCQAVRGAVVSQATTWADLGTTEKELQALCPQFFITAQ